MKHVHWSVLICTLIVIGIVPVRQSDATAANALTYHNPLAYIGIDGNIYVTDLNSGVGTAITNDAQTTCPDGTSPSVDYKRPFLRTYRNIRWSPIGGAFTFGLYSDLSCQSIQASIFLEKSNSHTQFLTSEPSNDLNGPSNDLSGVWSPDGTQVAYMDGDGIGVISLADGTTHHVSDYGYQPCIGEGPGIDDLNTLYFDERGIQPYQDPTFSLDWTEPGFLVPLTVYDDTNTSCGGLALLDQNNTVWKNDTLSSPSVSPDRKQALAVSAGSKTQDSGYALTTVLIDLASGKLTPLPFLSANDGPFVWTPDGKQILYVTVELNTHRSDESKVSLWSVPIAGGAATRLLTRVGFGIGVITPSPDGKGAAFSLVTSTPVGATRSNPAIATGTDHIELLYVDFATHAVKRIALGRWPAFGTGDFTVLPAKQSQ